MSHTVKKLIRMTDRQLRKCLNPVPGHAKDIYDAMNYSVFAGGKRMRPVFCLLAAKACGLGFSKALPAAAAIEMVHTYSLIHDDLPAMDDDRLRRGRPTSHIRFGEANAILAGDALLTLAFETILKCADNIKPERVIKASALLAQAAGVRGMVGGQAADMKFEGRKPSKKALSYIHSHKTGAMIRASAEIGAVLAGAGRKEQAALRRFGEKAGMAFQIADDILDITGDAKKLGKTKGKDLNAEKATYPAVYGIKSSGRRARKLVLEAAHILSKIGSNAALKELEKLARYIVERSY